MHLSCAKSDIESCESAVTPIEFLSQPQPFSLAPWWWCAGCPYHVEWRNRLTRNENIFINFSTARRPTLLNLNLAKLCKSYHRYTHARDSEDGGGFGIRVITQLSFSLPHSQTLFSTRFFGQNKGASACIRAGQRANPCSIIVPTMLSKANLYIEAGLKV